MTHIETTYPGVFPLRDTEAAVALQDSLTGKDYEMCVEVLDDLRAEARMGVVGAKEIMQAVNVGMIPVVAVARGEAVKAYRDFLDEENAFGLITVNPHKYKKLRDVSRRSTVGGEAKKLYSAIVQLARSGKKLVGVTPNDLRQRYAYLR